MTATNLSPRRAAPATWSSVPAAPAPDPAYPGSEVAGILDELVAAIDVRESFDPESSGWDTGALIRRLERELARAWMSARRPETGLEAGRRWHQ